MQINIKLLFFLLLISPNAFSENFYSNCPVPSGSIGSIKTESEKFTLFKLNNGEVGGCSTDRKSRHGAPFWERVELAQRGTLSKNKTHEIEFKIKILEGMTEDRETFFQIHNYRDNDSKNFYPSLMLKFSQQMLRVDFLNANNSHAYEYIKNPIFRDLENYYNKFYNFKIIISNLETQNNFGETTIIVNNKLLFSGYPTFFPKDGTPRIKYGIYRPGNKEKNKTSSIQYSEIKIRSY